MPNCNNRGCNWKCCVVIGESIDDVAQSATHYGCGSWDGKAIPESEDLDPVLGRKNAKWMLSVMRSCCAIIDIQLEPGRLVRSPYYALEKELIAANNYGCVTVANRIPPFAILALPKKCGT